MQKTHMFYAPIRLSPEFPICGPDFARPPEFAHLHDCFEIGFCRKGSGGVFQIGGKIYSCDPDCAVFINDREYHILTNATPENSQWEFINLDPVGMLMGWIPPQERMFKLDRLSGAGFRNIYSESEAPDLIQFTKLLLNEMKKKERCSQSCVRALVWAIFTKLNEYAPEAGAEEDRDRDRIARLYPALQYISKHYTSVIDIPTLAARCNMSLTAFRLHFRKCIGMLPLEYVNTCRLKAAAVMLKNTSRQIVEIAGRTGFPTLSHFNRSFRSYYACSPRDYRQRHQPPQVSAPDADV